MIKNRKSVIFAASLLIILIVLGISVSNNNKHAAQNNRRFTKESLSDEQKTVLKYNYEIPYEFKVLDIVSENELLIDNDNKIKLYNLDEKKFKEDIIEVNKGYLVRDAKAFEKGIVWIESIDGESPGSKIFIKYLGNDNIQELDRSNAAILPSISVNSNYLTYYIVDKDENINVKLFELGTQSSKTIASYKLQDSECNIYVSCSNTNGYEVVWSETTRTGIGSLSNIYSYNIKDDTVKVLSKDTVLTNPVIKNDRIFAIEREDFYDSEIDTDYASDFIVEYNPETGIWDKFEENRIDNYISYPRECVTYLFTNEGPLSWASTFEVDSIYDIDKREFISLMEDNSDLMVNIDMVKNNIIYYMACDYEDKESKLIYIMPHK